MFLLELVDCDGVNVSIEVSGICWDKAVSDPFPEIELQNMIRDDLK